MLRALAAMMTVLRMPLRYAWPAPLVGAVLLGAVWSARPSATPAERRPSTTTAQDVLTQFCAACHRRGRSGIDLDGPVDQDALAENRSAWESVLDKLRSYEMPPPNVRTPQPSSEERE